MFESTELIVERNVMKNLLIKHPQPWESTNGIRTLV